MTWMSLPSTAYDKYVDPVNGSNSNTGNTWAQAYLSLAQAASASGSYGRVWLAPGTYTLTSPVSYNLKRLQWIGPPITGGWKDNPTGAVAYITGSGLARYFDARVDSGGSAASNLYGGGFHSLMFNMAGINVGGEAIRVRQGNYMQMSDLHGWAPAGTFRASYIIHDSEEDYAAAYDKQDRSWWNIRDIYAWNCAMMRRSLPSRSSRGANGWSASNLHGDTDAAAGATIPYWDNEQRTHFRMVMDGGSFGNNATGVSCIKLDGRLSTANPNVTMTGVSFHDMRSPYYGLQVYHAHVAILYPGSNGTTGGLIRLEADTDGFVAAPRGSVSLAGAWPNYPYKDGDGTF